jgi:hypothetical protein
MVSLSHLGPTTTLNQKAYYKPTIVVPLQNEWFTQWSNHTFSSSHISFVIGAIMNAKFFTKI